MTLEAPPIVARSSIDRVWEALDLGGYSPEKRGDRFMALCPVHNDKHRSLSVSYDRRNELTMLHCFTCQADIRDITAALGLTVQDTFDRPLPDRPKSEWGTRSPRKVAFRAPHKLPPRLTRQSVLEDDVLKNADWKITTTYPYANTAGEVVQEVVREQATIDGITHKRFTQRFLGASGRMVARKPQGFTPVLYHHGAVLAAIAEGKTVWIVEGEKDADNATAIGLVATTNAQGAGSFPAELADLFTGAAVNVVADRDAAGYKRAVALHDMLTSRGATVRLLLPAVDEEKADLTDHLDAGLGVESLTEISAQDAGVLARLGDARKLLSYLEVCELEATAHVHAATGADADAHKTSAQTWAEEADRRYRKIAEISSGDQLFADSYGPAGTHAAAQLSKVVLEAAKRAAKVHEIAAVPVPSAIAKKLEQSAPGRVITIAGSGGDGHGFDGNAFVPGDDGDPNIGTEFIVRYGETVQVRLERDGDGYRRRYHRILRGWAEVQNIAVDDDGTDTSRTRPTHEMSVRFFRWIRDEAGHPILDDDQQPQIEQATVKWDADQLRDGSWTQALPWPGMLETSSRRGKDTAWDAIFNARPAPTTRSTVYTATGWRDSETGPFFIHAAGAIAKGGSLDRETGLPDAFSVYKMPEPTTEAERLRDAWQEGTLSVVDQLPARVVAPLFGVVWESVFERVPLITHLVGGRAAYKTSTARLACQYFAPELHYHGRREVLSGANMGGTVIGLIRALSIANNLPVLIDDMAPDGDAKRAQRKLSELARLVYNGTGRVTGKQRGGIATDAPTQASVITTGELGITGSGQTRLLCIPLDPGSIADGSRTFAELEKASRRRARGLLGASLIRWIAQHRDALRAEQQALIEDPNGPGSVFAHWQKRVENLPHDEGLKGRLIEAATAADHGVKLMLRMMVTSRALTTEDADAFYQWAEKGIYEAIAMQDAASGDPAEQLLGYLREALSSGACHLTTDKGDVPENADALGWRTVGKGDFASWAPNGPRVGVIKGEGSDARLYLIPSVVIGVANQVALRADETFAETSVSISSALAAHGWLEVDNSGKRGVGRRIGGQLMRVWDIPFSVLTGGDDDTPPTEEAEPPTIPPSLFDVDGGVTPPAAPTAPAPEPQAPTAPAQPSNDTPRPQSAPLPKTARNAATAQPDFRAAVAVLHTDGLWMPDGTNMPLPRPINHLGDVAAIVANLNLGTKNGWKNEDGQLIVTKEAALALDIPVDKVEGVFESDRTKKLQELTLNHPLITGAIDAGFMVGGQQPAFNGTTRIWHEENRRLRARFVLMSTLKSDFAHIIADNPTPATIALRLQRFADALHAPFAVSASSTGIDLMLSLHHKKQSELYFTPSEPVPPAEISTLEADIDWHRKPTAEEATHRWVHAYDRNGSYLAGVSGLELGYGQPTYLSETDRITFDKRIPGYWRIVMPERGEWNTPNPFDPRNRAQDFTGELTWVTTQTLDIAEELGYDPIISEAWIWQNHSRIYDTWYERIRDARTALYTPDEDDQVARSLLKEVYVRTLGLTASFEHHRNRRAFAPERYHLIQARAKANILRRVHQIGNATGRWPVAISKDTVLYTSNETDPDIAWPGDPKNYNNGLGQYKYEGSAPLAEHIRFLTGIGRYEGKSDLEKLI